MALNPKLKWWILPPAAALVLFLGPFRTQTKPAPVEPPTAAPATGTEAAPGARSAPEPVKIPDAWQVISTLVGVLLLGGVGIVLLGRLRNASPRGATNLVTLRQSLRLGSRNSLHAVEFDDEILLVGECDGKLSVVHRGPREQVLTDEVEVLTRDDEEGAVPKDLVIPRPAAKKAANPPTPPRTPKPQTQKSQAAKPTAKPLSDFRALMRRVKAGQS